MKKIFHNSEISPVQEIVLSSVSWYVYLVSLIQSTPDILSTTRSPSFIFLSMATRFIPYFLEYSDLLMRSFLSITLFITYCKMIHKKESHFWPLLDSKVINILNTQAKTELYFLLVDKIFCNPLPGMCYNHPGLNREVMRRLSEIIYPGSKTKALEMPQSIQRSNFTASNEMLFDEVKLGLALFLV